MAFWNTYSAGASRRSAAAARREGRTHARNAARAPPPRSAPTSPPSPTPRSARRSARPRAVGAAPSRGTVRSRGSSRSSPPKRASATRAQTSAASSSEKASSAALTCATVASARRRRASVDAGARERQRPRLAASRQRRAAERAHDAARERRLRRRARPAQLDEAVPEPGQVPSLDRGHALEAPATVRRGDGRVHDKLRQVGARPRVRRGGRVDVAEATAAERFVGAVPAVRVERPRVPALAPRRGVPPRRLDDPSGLREPRDPVEAAGREAPGEARVGGGRRRREGREGGDGGEDAGLDAGPAERLVEARLRGGGDGAVGWRPRARDAGDGTARPSAPSSSPRAAQHAARSAAAA